MKFLIWVGCIFALSLITVLLKYAGILLGGIPTFVLASLMFWSARTLCKKWDVHKKTREKVIAEKVTDKHANSRKVKYNTFMISSLISCAYTLFIVLDIIWFGYFEYIDALLLFLLYIIPIILILINNSKKRLFIDIILFLWILLLICCSIGYGTYPAPDISMEIEVSYFILPISTFIQLICSVIELFNIKKLYYGSLTYRKRCYKKIEEMKRYFDSDVISKEEFEYNKREILKKITDGVSDNIPNTAETNINKIDKDKTIPNGEESTKPVDTKEPAPSVRDDVFREKVETVKVGKLSNEEWEYFYKTDFEKFWEMVIEEYDLSKLPNRIGNLRDDTMIYGEDARKVYLSRLRGVVEYNEWTTKNRPEVIDIHWNTLKKLKKELQEKTSDKVYMLDVIRNYEDKYIRY